jgi:hypothetical protein
MSGDQASEPPFKEREMRERKRMGRKKGKGEGSGVGREEEGRNSGQEAGWEIEVKERGGK